MGSTAVHASTDRGREAAIEIPPMDDDQSIPRVETAVDREHTNLAGAMKLAQASFPHDAGKRVVVISDGNQNVGDALVQARALADSGIGIDVVPIRSRVYGEVAVEKVTIPSDVRRGQPFDLRVVLANTAGEGQEARPVDGRLIVVRKAGGREQVLTEQDITLGLARLKQDLRAELEPTGVLEAIGEHMIFPTLPTVLEAFEHRHDDASA